MKGTKSNSLFILSCRELDHLSFHRLPYGRFLGDPKALITITPADGLPGMVAFGSECHGLYGSGNPPNHPWAWGWVFLGRYRRWMLRPVFLPDDN